MILKIWQFHYCSHRTACVLTRPATTWSQLAAVMTRPCNSWLMDTSLCPAELIAAENAQQAAALFSCVNFVISACLTIPDQYSIKEIFAFSWSVASRCESSDAERRATCRRLKIRRDCGRRWERKGEQEILSDRVQYSFTQTQRDALAIWNKWDGADKMEETVSSNHIPVNTLCSYQFLMKELKYHTA